MQFCISVLGNTAFMAEEKPVRLSVQVINMSSKSRFLMLFRMLVQNFALSFSPIYMPSLYLWS